MTYVRLCMIVLCSLLVVSGQTVHAQEGTPATEAEGAPGHL